jgi:hypothetical protein
MHNHRRTRLLITTAAITFTLTAPLLAAGTPAFASGRGGGGGVSTSGTCTNGGHFKLKAKHDDGRIEMEYQVDSNHVTTAGPSGSFEIRKVIANRPGLDTIHAHATFKNHTCGGTVKL